MKKLLLFVMQQGPIYTKVTFISLDTVCKQQTGRQHYWVSLGTRTGAAGRVPLTSAHKPDFHPFRKHTTKHLTCNPSHARAYLAGIFQISPDFLFNTSSTKEINPGHNSVEDDENSTNCPTCQAETRLPQDNCDLT